MQINLPCYAAKIIERLESSGFEAWVVGGCVRDSLLGQTPDDWDIATNALPEQVVALFQGYTVVETGLKHGTVTVVSEGHNMEVTTYRIDGVYEDCRHPEQVVFTDDIHRDLKRRDFTVNAMAYHPIRGIIDDFGGQKDLKNRKICAVGDPALRVREDALRIMRGLRFAAVLGFSLDSATADALKENRALLQNIAAERIRVELSKLLCGQNVKPILLEYRDVLAEIIPELSPMFGFEQKNPHHYLDVWSHTVEALAASKPDLTVRLGLLFHDIGKPSCFSVDEKGVGHFYGHPDKSEEIAVAVLNRLRFDHATIQQVRQLVRWHDCDILPEGKSVKRWLNRLGEDGMRQLLAVKAADRGATNHRFENWSVLALVEQKMETVLRENQCFTREKLAISGKDLLALGVPEGPEVGALLDELLNLVIEEKMPNQPTVLRNRAKAMLQKR